MMSKLLGTRRDASQNENNKVIILNLFAFENYILIYFPAINENEMNGSEIWSNENEESRSKKVQTWPKVQGGWTQGSFLWFLEYLSTSLIPSLFLCPEVCYYHKIK